MTHQAAFITGLQGDHSEAPSRAFERWAEMGYCALAKPAARPPEADKLEARYQRLADQIGPARVHVSAELLALVVEDLTETGGKDFLGGVAQHDDVRAVNQHAGQFFTPHDVSRLMAEMTLGDAAQLLDAQPYLTIGEPASGAGGMLLAAVMVLKDAGVNVTTRVWIDATDVSAFCFHLTFIQLALVGCSGVARQGNTLSLEMYETALLPMSPLFLARHGWPGERGVPARHIPAVNDFEVVLNPPGREAGPVPLVASAPFALARESAPRRHVQADLFGAKVA